MGGTHTQSEREGLGIPISRPLWTCLYRISSQPNVSVGESMCVCLRREAQFPVKTRLSINLMANQDNSLKPEHNSYYCHSHSSIKTKINPGSRKVPDHNRQKKNATDRTTAARRSKRPSGETKPDPGPCCLDHTIIPREGPLAWISISILLLPFLASAVHELSFWLLCVSAYNYPELPQLFWG